MSKHTAEDAKLLPRGSSLRNEYCLIAGPASGRRVICGGWEIEDLWPHKAQAVEPAIYLHRVVTRQWEHVE